MPRLLPLRPEGATAIRFCSAGPPPVLNTTGSEPREEREEVVEDGRTGVAGESSDFRMQVAFSTQKK